MPALPVLGHALVRSPALQWRRGVVLPDAALLELPERAVQFGTGAFLRGFVDCFLDEANRGGAFGGRVVAIGSTGSGRDRRIDEQNGLYTLLVRGLAAGAPHREQRVIASISRALSAHERWDEVLRCARDPQLELVFSNTTEVGIVLDEEDDPALVPPRSFPGKLTRFLHERALAVGFDAAKGVVVLPCELIEGNGDRLREIVLALAARWRLGARFTEWIARAVRFCNTLVDRIVPGAPPEDEVARLTASLGYRDALLTTCEPYRLFAIEGDEALRRRLRFAAADPGVVVAEDIRPYRVRKVGLLNGPHTLMAPAALLAGCETVREAVRHELVGRLVHRAMFEEIAPTLGVPGAEPFAREVLDRFANPDIRHALADITLQGTMKMRVRVVPSIQRYVARHGRPPASIAFGFAAHLLFMRGDLHDAWRRTGRGVPRDEAADRLREWWTSAGGTDAAALAARVRELCADESLWSADLSALPGFVAAVSEHLSRMRSSGIAAALDAHLATAASA